MYRYRAGERWERRRGGYSDLSEWQRSADAKELRRRRQMLGTATGQGSNDLYRTVHELSAATRRMKKRLP